MKIPSEASGRVARSLLATGPATAPELADRLGMTPAGIRRHLDALESEGLVVAGERAPFGPAPTRGRGRPPKVYAISDSGRDAFEKSYDDLAVAALRFLQQRDGSSAVAEFADSRATEMERRYGAALAGVSGVAERAQRLATALNGDGYAASVVTGAAGSPALQICQHNCPVAHVAAEFPELCEMESQAFGRLLDTHVTRLATIAHGDGVCTTVVTADLPTRPHERIPS